MRVDDLGPFDSVLDVGGNVGEFAELCRLAWPEATITSFEPLLPAARMNEKRAAGRWWVERAAVSSSGGRGTLRFCTNQHSASTMQEPGTLRRERFGIVDVFEEVDVPLVKLDAFRASSCIGRCLLKVDTEGHELEVFRGAELTLREVAVVVVEVNQSPDIFIGAPSPQLVDATLRQYGLKFAGVLAVQADPRGDVVQFDGVWSRSS